MTTEKRLAAKLPGEDTGIEIRHSMCDICTPGPHCGLDVYVRDGKVIKVEGTRGYPGSDGKLCVKGAATREYLYRADRIRTPLRRTGPRGSGRFEPIGWEEALSEAARALNTVKEKDGPEAVAWMCGYSKWFRAYLQRLAYSFGSPNYMTESSACHEADVCAWKALFGSEIAPDRKNASLILVWGSNPFANAYPLARQLMECRERGARIVVIDPRDTPAARKLADLYIRPRLGTDGALAHGAAKYILDHGMQDQAYIDRYVEGFAEYRAYVDAFDLETTAAATGVPAGQIARLAEMIGTAPSCVVNGGTAMTHRVNGFNNVRAILSLLVIRGQFDRPGGMLPTGTYTFAHSTSGIVSHELEYATATRPKTEKPGVGRRQFPVFAAFVDQCQGMALADQILSADPYPIRAAACFGVNHMLYPDSNRFLRAMDSLDFIVATDIFMTDMCRHADIVLPASTSLERSEVKLFGPVAAYFKPVIPPVWDNRDDVQIMAELAKHLGLDDPLLCAGYDAGAQFMLSESGMEDWEAFRRKGGFAPVPNHRPPPLPGSALAAGLPTPSGKIELSSGVIAALGREELDPLPVYVSSDDGADPAAYPFVVCAGARLHHAIHSRVHNCPTLRALRPEPAVDIHPKDARRLGLQTGDQVELFTAVGAIRVQANVTAVTNVGELQMYHGYREANVNLLLDASRLDPYTGFPSYKQFRAGLRKV